MLKLWNLRQGKFLRTLDEQARCVLSVAIDGSGQTLVSGCWDKTIKLWNLRMGGRLTCTFARLPDVVTSVALSRDGRFLANGSWDNTVTIWERQQGDVT
ncbi:MAG: hypothetical protein E6J34_07155 [Chloroflexi bacterium]|nr:MAG: hypothetical protein E6J34_07155 [Chloroflexota bacterium]